jgi:hypothetical protein
VIGVTDFTNVTHDLRESIHAGFERWEAHLPAGVNVNVVRMSTRGIATMICAILAATGAAALAGNRPAPAAPAGHTDPELQTFALLPAATSTRGFGRAAADVVSLAQRATKPFSMLGATWSDPHRKLDGTVEVRTRAAGGNRWSTWRALDADEPDAADRPEGAGLARGSTDPLWVGDSNAVEARAVTGRSLPAGLRLDLINTAAPVLESAAVAGVQVPDRPIPDLVTRAGWGADEALVTHPPEYTSDVRVVFVHHTAGTNGYSCDQSRSIIRGIQRYQVLSKGWNDVGYNFLVDKCGTLFEGRRGGVNLPVLGAHTLGFNSHSTAIAVLGDYSGQAVPDVVRTVIAQVAAYKLGTYGLIGSGQTVLVSNGSDRYPAGTPVTLNRISGHRDTGRTACPGDALYSQLPGVRVLAAGAPAHLVTARISGATRRGATYYARGLIRPVWTTTTSSKLLNRFDVYVDGKLVQSAPNTFRNVLVGLTPGRHRVQVRAVHQNGRTASTTTSVYMDRTPPQFTAGPTLALRMGTLNGVVPVRLGWVAADAGSLRSVAMTSPAAISLGTVGHGRSATARAGVPTEWRLRASDQTGNVATAAVTRTPVVASDAASLRTGRWRTVAGRAYLGRTAQVSTARNSSMTWSFTGWSASIAASRTPSSGRILVIVDGEPAGTVDLRSATALHRQAVWARYFGDGARHVIRIVVEGTPGRPGVLLDGLVHLY